MKITVIGSGYVGLVTGACLADVGNEVLCVDLDSRKIATLNEGGVPIHEPGLDLIISKNMRAGRLRFTTNVERGVEFGAIQIIAVGTPPDEDGSADLSYVLSAARNIGRLMTSERVVVTKSTVPVGTGEKVRTVIAEELKSRGVDVKFSVASNPEFLKEGAAIEDFMKPDRIIVGTEDEAAVDAMKALYAPFQRNHERLIFMNLKSAELTKYAANAMLATRISFMNELANLSEKLGADIELVRQGIGSDPRIGYHFLYPGVGYGGSCFPKDVKALIHTANKEANVFLRVLTAVEAANDAQKYVLVEKVKAKFGADLKGLHFAVWGLAFKPNTDDMREASSRVVISELLKAGATVAAYDPVAMKEAQRVLTGLQGLSFTENSLQAVEGADALIVITEWKEFRSPNFEQVKVKLRQPIIFDGRNVYDQSSMQRLGIEHYSIGRGTI